MSDTGKQSPLGVNTLNSYLNAQGLTINPVFTGYAGTSHNFSAYTFGSVCQNTVLRVITHAINQGYYGNDDGIPYTNTYNALITIGAGFLNIPISSIVSGIDPGTDHIWFKVTYTNNVTLTPDSYVKISNVTPNGYNGNWLIESVGSESAGTKYFKVAVTVNYGAATVPGTFTVDTQVPGLGNAKALVYTWESLIGRFGTGSFNLGDTKGWGGSTYKNNLEESDPNPATQWAYVRLMALQAWMEFNYNSTLEQGDSINPAGYRDFLQSFNSAAGFISYSNSAILPVDNSGIFLDGTYSNMNDLISGDITGISLATKAFGQDLISMGKVLNLTKIATFGLPSNLLKTLAQTNALTQNISLAIIATGINTNELGEILGNIKQPTIEQEQKLYAAFFLTVGQSLAEALIPLNCKTVGLTSVADLLNPKKIFPNSYETLTVPVYNTTIQQTNSKTYYPIYVTGSVNPNLTSPAVLSQIGTQTPVGTPQISTTTPSANITIQQPTIGFGSYLSTIVPPEQATACGAIAASFLQVKNITNVPVEKFGQVVTNIETIVGLPINGTNVPTNLALRTAGRPIIALGSGPQGTYTASDFFGCMSGLPYNGPLNNILARLQEVATRKLFNIYHETYLAVTQQRAKMSIEQPYWYIITNPYVPPTSAANPANPAYQPNPAAPNYDPNQYVNAPHNSPTYWSSPGSPEEYDWYYRVEFQVAVSGGGYGRGTAPNPAVSISPNNVGASSVSNVGRDDNDIPGMFGRVSTSNSYGNSYLWAHTVQDNWSGSNIYPTITSPQYPPKDSAWVIANMPEEVITIEAPPIQMLPIQTNGDFSTDGQNTSGFSRSYKSIISQGTWFWPDGGSNPGMNSPILGYIDQANSEINYINSVNRASCQSLNDSWNATGTQLTLEQRARQNGLKPPLDSVRQNYMSLFPTVVYNFVDGLAQYAKSTEPHMYAQTMENISDLQTPGGQSAVASMRQQRNQERLNLLGIDLDNNIEDKLPADQQKILIANGTLPTGRTNVNIPSGSTIGTTPTTPTEPTDPNNPIIPVDPSVPTTPATPGTTDPIGTIIITTPIGTIDPITGIYYPTLPDYGGQVPPIPLDNGNAFIPTGPGPVPGGTGAGGIGAGAADTGGFGTGTGTGVFGIDDIAASAIGARPFSAGGIGGIGTGGIGTGGIGAGGIGTGGIGIDGIGIGGIGLGAGGTGGFGTGTSSTGTSSNNGIGTPGSFAGTPYSNLIPPSLNSWYSSNTLYPSTYTVAQAIEEVIRCNCDCWQLA